jgi:hypothetical protein
MSPAEDYVVGVPVTAYGDHLNSRRSLEHRLLPGAPKAISSDVEPAEWARSMNIVFCGAGELFVAFAERPGKRPVSIGVYRGTDGKLLATSPALGPRAPDASSYVEFDFTGKHMLLMIQDLTIPSTPRYESLVYRLDR